MRCSLAFLCSILMVFCAMPLLAQESPQARQLQAQVEEIQQRLDQLRLHEGANRNVTEIGTSRGRTRNDGEPRLVVRIYDLADLYSIAPSYPAREASDLQDAVRFVFPEVQTSGAGQGPTAMGGMGGGMFSVPSSIPSHDPFKETLHQAAGGIGGSVSDSARTGVNNLIETITSTISPDEWADVGGQSSIKVLGASLIVSAPTHIHDKIAVLIDLFRKRWRSLRTISIDAHWLWLTELELASVPLNTAESVAFGVLTDSSWKKLRDLAQAHDRAGYHAIVTCYNGQTVHGVAGGQQLVVTGVVPIVGSKDSLAAYQPTIRMIQEGAALQVTPIATRTAKYVVADVHSRVNLLSGPADELRAKAVRPLAASDVSQVVAALDRPVLLSQRLSTTTRIPVDKPTLIGGMTFGSSAADSPNLYLFITSHVQELRDEEAETLVSPDGAKGSIEDKREPTDSTKSVKPE
jgi:hypothetical protein